MPGWKRCPKKAYFHRMAPALAPLCEDSCTESLLRLLCSLQSCRTSSPRPAPVGTHKLLVWPSYRHRPCCFCVSEPLSMSLCLSLSIYVCVRICISVCVCICIHMHVCVYVYAHIHMYIYTYMCVYDVCVYVYMYIKPFTREQACLALRFEACRGLDREHEEHDRLRWDQH